MYNPTASQQWGMIEEQARQLLNDTERGTLNYYLNEYQKDHVTVDALVLALFELLNTHAKVSDAMKPMLNTQRFLSVQASLSRYRRTQHP
jgi:hypothetical protein